MEELNQSFSDNFQDPNFLKTEIGQKLFWTFIKQLNGLGYTGNYKFKTIKEIQIKIDELRNGRHYRTEQIGYYIRIYEKKISIFVNN